jgi:glycerol-3-phosphate acyltransferase PlsX
MGGDGGLRVVLEAVLLALADGDGPFLLVGLQSEIKAELKGDLPEGLSILDASEVIGMNEPPIRVARTKSKSSIHVGMRAVKEGLASAFITAGNSGAALAVGVLVLKRLDGCERPAIASVLPTYQDPIVVLDLGANVECRSSHLAQFGVLGSAYAESYMGQQKGNTDRFTTQRPRVGLLSNGEETSKGTEALREAHRQLNSMDLNYIGYVEPRVIPFGLCDVVVTDGFVGNIVLKLSESIVEALFAYLRKRVHQKRWFKVIRRPFESFLKSFKKEIDWQRIGAAPILGLKHLVMVAHGASTPLALKTALHQTRRHLRSNITDHLQTALHSTPFSGSMSSTSEILIPKEEVSLSSVELKSPIKTIKSTEPTD